MIETKDVIVKILKAMEEDVEDLIDTHDKAAAN